MLYKKPQKIIYVDSNHKHLLERLLNYLLPLSALLFFPFLAWFGFAFTKGVASTYGFTITLTSASLLTFIESGAKILAIHALAVTFYITMLAALILVVSDHCFNRKSKSTNNKKQKMRYHKPNHKQNMSATEFFATLIFFIAIIGMFFVLADYLVDESYRLGIHDGKKQYKKYSRVLNRQKFNDCGFPQQISKFNFKENGKYHSIYGIMIFNTGEATAILSKMSNSNNSLTAILVANKNLEAVHVYQCNKK